MFVFLLSRVLGAVSPLVSAVRDCFRHRIGKRGRQKLFAILVRETFLVGIFHPAQSALCSLAREGDFALCDALAETESALWPNCEVVAAAAAVENIVGEGHFIKCEKRWGKQGTGVVL